MLYEHLGLRLGSEPFLGRVLEFAQVVLPQLLPIDVDVEVPKLLVDLLVVESLLREQIVFVGIFGLVDGDEHFLLLLLVDLDGDFADLFLELLATDDLLKLSPLQLLALVEVEVEVALGASLLGLVPLPVHLHVESLLDALDVGLFVRPQLFGVHGLLGLLILDQLEVDDGLLFLFLLELVLIF